ncbi:MAG TPA: tRNA (adenosine(37)-N6)-threonylcarbamoyltransferase complex ATPase subunit type 1 TsaE [Candidatus Paceibacterota bacterium]
MRPAVTLQALDALAQEAEAFIASRLPKESGATLVTLSGELGAGKTTFTQAVARALGITEPVTSPTFVLAKSYALPEGLAFRELLHIDAYRLAGGKDLDKIGVPEALQDTGTLILLEWPERVADGLPPADVTLRLEANEDGTRTLTYA